MIPITKSTRYQFYYKTRGISVGDDKYCEAREVRVVGMYISKSIILSSIQINVKESLHFSLPDLG